MDDAVADGVSEGGIAVVVPVTRMQLACDDGRSNVVPVLADFEKVASLVTGAIAKSSIARTSKRATRASRRAGRSHLAAPAAEDPAYRVRAQGGAAHVREDRGLAGCPPPSPDGEMFLKLADKPRTERHEAVFPELGTP